MIFRYPGGKCRLLTEIYGCIESCGFKNGEVFHDVFVGGGSVLLRVAQESPRSMLFANDFDPWIKCFWEVIAGPRGDFNSLVERLNRKPTIEDFVRMRGEPPKDHVDQAYRAVFFNRTTFSGMFRSGPIGGYDQSGNWKIDCRYNTKQILSDMFYIRDKLHLGERLHVTGMDAISYIPPADGFLYLDPPYMGQGKALYRVGVDHEKLSKELMTKDRWLLNYDDCERVRELYSQAAIEELPTRYSIRGKKRTWTGAKELFITPGTIAVPWKAETLTQLCMLPN